MENVSNETEKLFILNLNVCVLAVTFFDEFKIHRKEEEKNLIYLKYDF